VDDASLTEFQFRNAHRDLYLKAVLGPAQLILYSVGVGDKVRERLFGLAGLS